MKKHPFMRFHWWGKIIGAFLGYLIWGPAGTLLGILIGNIFDRGLAAELNKPYWDYRHGSADKTAQAIFLDTTFFVMGYIAKIDGRVSENEIYTAKKIMDELHLTQRQRQFARSLFKEGKNNSFDLEKHLSLLRQSSSNNRPLLRIFCDFIYKMALTDGFSENKRMAVNKIFRYFGFAPLHKQYHTYDDFFNDVFNQYRYKQNHRTRSSYEHNQSSYSSNSSYQQSNYELNTLNASYKLLGVSPQANKNEVKKAYRRLISKHHPDRLIAKGANEAEIKKATDITQKISKAYDKICNKRGW